MVIFFPPSKTFPNTLKQQNFNYHQESVAHCCCSNLDKSAHTLSAWGSHCPRWPKSSVVDSANMKCIGPVVHSGLSSTLDVWPLSLSLSIIIFFII